jgi:hypothetical protein
MRDLLQRRREFNNKAIGGDDRAGYVLQPRVQKRVSRSLENDPACSRCIKVYSANH